MKTTLTLISLTILLTSCATMKNGPQQVVRIDTPKMHGARCDLSNQRGHWHIDSTPAQVKIDRAASPLVIQCHKGMAAGTTTIKSSFQKHSIFGGVSGMSVDVATGSAYVYPSSIKVPMARVR